MPLWLLMLFALAALAAAGLAVKFICDQRVGPEEVTWTEYWISVVLCALIVCPVTGWVGVKLAKRDNVTFHEHWNGWEAAVSVIPTECSEDGPCRWNYDCDPYIVEVPYECGDGKNSRTCYRPETRYHSCPYVSTEYTYVVNTTLGPYTIDSSRFPENPEHYRWREWHHIPQSVIENAGVGEPPFWSAARDRIASRNPGPVTKVKSYANYILASHYTILKGYRKGADELLAKHLLPPVATGIRENSFYRADKTALVGCGTQNAAPWNENLERLNAGLGSELHGDTRLVLVCDRAIAQNPDQYMFALRAYWQDTTAFRRGALPKNTIVVIVGTTDGKTVAWGRAFTGMPLGNEALIQNVKSRFMASKGVPWTPEAVIGSVVGQVSSEGDSYTVSSLRGSGVLTDTFWGTGNPATRFARVSMQALDKGDVGSGFRYLATEIVITGGQKALIVFFAGLFSALLFLFVAFHDHYFTFTNSSNGSYPR